MVMILAKTIVMIRYKKKSHLKRKQKEEESLKDGGVSIFRGEDLFGDNITKWK